MTIALVAPLSSVIAERVSLTVGLRLLAPLLAVGVFSPLSWRVGDIRGVGTLRSYALVQFGSWITISLMLWHGRPLARDRLVRAGQVFDFGIELLTCPVNRETIAAIEAWPVPSRPRRAGGST